MITFNEPESIQDILQRVVKDLKQKNKEGSETQQERTQNQ